MVLIFYTNIAVKQRVKGCVALLLSILIVPLLFSLIVLLRTSLWYCHTGLFIITLHLTHIHRFACVELLCKPLLKLAITVAYHRGSRNNFVTVTTSGQQYFIQIYTLCIKRFQKDVHYIRTYISMYQKSRYLKMFMQYCWASELRSCECDIILFVRG